MYFKNRGSIDWHVQSLLLEYEDRLEDEELSVYSKTKALFAPGKRKRAILVSLLWFTFSGGV